ncbi:FAD-dependent monooxygenase [Ovoidimarina sediminis]|uniref:FAD-dependent monooxygenase n=1 Tax=Ovoidimarina sediminis TaxID=3079856 RepID=UPI002911CC46|nr:FAD-dependent monooxygenase [Rhodophyticola sp. MJ-SS7]MDU8943797.1 FAD-dependent monooxygenase [Rhodophyticola sp. MJ-SS7]
MTERTDIVVAGGGLNGTALALALASGGFSVTMVDPVKAEIRADAGFDGRGYALSLSSVQVLKALGLWAGLQGNAQPILDIRITDGRPGEGPSPLMLEFDHREIEEGPMGFMIEDRFVRQALLAAVAKSDLIDHRDGVGAADHKITPADVTVSFTDGGTCEAALLIGCDGKASPTARRSGIRRQGWAYGQTALVCAVSHELPHEGCAHQYFLPAGPLAILPLPGNRSSIVWTERETEARRIMALDEAGYLEVLRPRFGGFLGEISLAGARFSYPLSLSLTDRLVSDRVALAGDAAHAVHPIAGQGLNAGLKDVAALAEVLVDARRRGEDIGTTLVLERYQRWRRFDIATLALATDAFNRLFSNNNPILRVGRDLGLAAVNAMPGLRRGFIREAAGLTGDLPRLAKGQPL